MNTTAHNFKLRPAFIKLDEKATSEFIENKYLEELEPNMGDGDIVSDTVALANSWSTWPNKYGLGHKKKINK